jgi:hypothetical protein
MDHLFWLAKLSSYLWLYLSFVVGMIQFSNWAESPKMIELSEADVF